MFRILHDSNLYIINLLFARPHVLLFDALLPLMNIKRQSKEKKTLRLGKCVQQMCRKRK